MPLDTVSTSARTELSAVAREIEVATVARDEPQRAFDRLKLPVVRAQSPARRGRTYAAAHFHTFGGRAEFAARINQFWSRWTEAMQPQPGQQCGTSLLPSNVTITKKGPKLYKLMAGDVELAEKMAKREGLPFEDCLKAVAEVNALNTPSYLGGDMIRKGDSSVKKQKKLRKRFAEMAVQTGVAVPLLNHIERVEKSLGGEYWEWADGYYNGRRQLNDVRFNTRAPSRW